VAFICIPRLLPAGLVPSAGDGDDAAVSGFNVPRGMYATPGAFQRDVPVLTSMARGERTTALPSNAYLYPSAGVSGADGLWRTQRTVLLYLNLQRRVHGRTGVATSARLGAWFLIYTSQVPARFSCFYPLYP